MCASALYKSSLARIYAPELTTISAHNKPLSPELMLWGKRATMNYNVGRLIQQLQNYDKELNLQTLLDKEEVSSSVGE
jgi:hypothetical protein